MSNHSLYYTTFSSLDEAKKAVEDLLSKNLIACANVLSESMSLYRWEGQIKCESEWPVLLKSRSSLKEAIVKTLVENHLYENPCLLEIKIDGGSQDFLSWITKETSNEAD